jgi:hypothetical protein
VSPLTDRLTTDLAALIALSEQLEADLAAATSNNAAIQAELDTCRAQIAVLQAPATISVTVSGPVAEDSTGMLHFTLQRSGYIAAPLTVGFTVSGTATAGTDYPVISNATAIFPANAATVVVTVDPTADTTVEPNETVILTIAPGSGYTVGNPASATGTITNDDAPPVVATYLSDLTPTDVSNGWGPYERDRANGEQGAADGGQLTIRGNVYPKGIGTHAPSSLTYALGGAYSRFQSFIGIDDAAGQQGSVIFSVVADGTTVYTSPLLTRASAVQFIDLSVTGVQYLRLVANPSGDAGWDWADWADAKLLSGTPAPTLPSVTVAADPVSVTEDGAPNAVYTFTRTGSTTNELVVNYTVTGSATSGTDYTHTGTTMSPTVTFIAGSSTATVTVNPTADTNVEADETVTLTVAPGTGYTIGAANTATATIANDDVPVSPGGTLGLTAAPWYGGNQYWAQFSVAAQTEWASPNFFPICVFYGKPEHAAQLKARGINTYLRAENPQGHANVNIMTNEGLYLILQPGWEPSQLGANPNRVVGWMASEEIEMFGPGTCPDKLSAHMGEVNRRRAYNDGRFLQANYGNGVLMTHWCPSIMDDLVASVDTNSCDKYAYTSPHVREWLFPNTWDWTNEYGASAYAGRSIAYGWCQRQMQKIGNTLNGSPTGNVKPSMVFVEVARPYLFDEPEATTIGLEEMEGAVWNTLIYGAAGVLWFQHNNDYANGGTYSIVQWNTPERPAKVQAINEQVIRMAPVLNSQPLVWNFGANIESRLSVQGGYAWIIAMGNGSGGSRTFTLPPALANATTVTVFEENRTRPVTGGQFTDSFAAEHEHHIYRIAL